MTCKHDAPDVCVLLGRHLHSRTLEIWRGLNIDPSQAVHFIEKWIATAPDPFAAELLQHVAKFHTKVLRAAIRPCRHRGAVVRDEEGHAVPACLPCRAKGNVSPKLFACAVHGTCTLDKRVDDVPACCADCDDYSPRPVIQVSNVSAGIGDHLLSLTIAEGLRQQHPESDVVYSCQGWVGQWVSLFAGEVTHTPLKVQTVHCDHNNGNNTWQRFTAAGVARWEWWAQEFGVKPVIPSVKPIPAAAQERAIPYGGRVVISPFSAFKERTWAVEKWLEVERMLLERGFRTVVLHSNQDAKLARFKGHKMIGEPAQIVAAMMRNAVCFVGNDSGMAHVAGMLAVPSVVVCGDSDNNIMGMYPDTHSMGGRPRKFDGIEPSAVVDAILAKVRAGLGAFPADRWGRIILERDRWRLANWEAVYATLWRTVRDLAPRRIVEVGTRGGYSAWTILDAAPEATLHGIDGNFAEHGGFVGAFENARAINPDRFTLELADSHTLERLPACDLVYVDGDHSHAGALADMMLVDRSEAPVMIVDDVTNVPEVYAAVKEFVRLKGWTMEYRASDTGLAILRRA